MDTDIRIYCIPGAGVTEPPLSNVRVLATEQYSADPVGMHKRRWVT